MKMDTKKKSLTDWDLTTLVASWRYYEHRHTIISSTFPHEIVGRFFLGAYDGQSCKRIARQFVGIDHLCGPDDEMDGWAGNEECDAIYRTVIVALLALTAIYFCWLGWMKARQPVVERAAYLEGRYGLDHDTAMVYARNILECP